MLLLSAPQAAAGAPYVTVSVNDANPQVGDLVSIVVISEKVQGDNSTVPSEGPVQITATESTGGTLAALTGIFDLNAGVYATSIVFNASMDFDKLYVHVQDLNTNATADVTISLSPSWSSVKAWIAARDKALAQAQADAQAAQSAAEDLRITYTLSALVFAVAVFELYRVDRHWKATKDFTLRERLAYVFRFSRGPLGNPLLQVLAEDSKVPDVKWDLERDQLRDKEARLERDLAKLGEARRVILSKRGKVPDLSKYIAKVDTAITDKTDALRETRARSAALKEHIEKERKREGLDPDWHGGRSHV